MFEKGTLVRNFFTEPMQARRCFKAAAVLALFTLGYQTSFAQDKRARDAYEKGQKALSNRDMGAARKEFQKAVERDENYGEAYFRLAQLFEYDRNLEESAKYYQKAVTLKPDSPEVQPAFLWLGAYYLKTGNYAQAAPLLEKYLEVQKSITKPSPILKISLKRAQRMLDVCRFSQEAVKHPLTVQVKKLPDVINAFDSQYFPVLTADRQHLFFTGIEQPNGDENLYISSYTEELGWTKPRAVSGMINTDENEGTSSISADGRTLVFTVCQSRLRRGYGNCDLYITYRNGDQWTEPENLGPQINSAAWESQPTLSPDGRVIFFVSDRPGGLGKRDIWMSKKDSLGRWMPSVNAGPAINTTEDEVSPFLHANGTSLFFASDGYTGLGGFDLWLTEFDGKTFSKPENLGYPLNNHEDQVALYITADGRKGYYSQEDRIETDHRQSRLWELDVPETLASRFKRAHVLKGSIVDATTKKPLVAALEVINLKTKEKEAVLRSDNRTGEYAVVLTSGNEYAVFVNRPGYLYKSLSFDFSGTSADKVLNIALEAIRKDQHEILKNVFFDSGKWEIKEKSQAELEKLVKLLNENPSVSIEISGHTDDIGEDKNNKELSLKRARSVTDYLTSQGISAHRIKAVGYGETQPVVSNTDEESRALNRRIEVKIL
ncbi:OmpA family protein [Siphonobacter sp. SORGH_AS_1065]|uniref:OmpA family protein n=1 Tax=Siphonobacter sp. SORGH_AS_1065 TaxID=3041795 RepID=UPI002785BA7F|nr:OmpA family protein [Siphonobacter sp. SORGH_AS_1065]MDQ1089091.1 outer membrane protein OmpA-like peptidoglycan-associated protein [Siphonobacter sp. SORGH_AS_1065]